MTENEAIIILKGNFPKTCKMVDGRYQGGFDDTECDLGKALSLSISALKEIRQYREIGTVRELKEMKLCAFSGIELASIAIAMQEFRKYKAVGTVEECMAQKALDDGITHAQTTGRLNKWITGLYFRNTNADNIRIYGDNAYIFCGSILITVIRVPENIRKDMQKMIRKHK